MKKNILTVAAYAVFLIVFNVLFFVVGGAERSSSVWLSYAFIHAAYIISIATFYLQPKSKNGHVFSFGISIISLIYFAVEFIIGLIFILVAPTGYKLALTLQIIPLGLYIVFAIIYYLNNKTIAEKEGVQATQINFIKLSSADIRALISLTDNDEVKRGLENLYDIMHSSPATSIAEAKAVENEITALIAELQSVITSDVGTIMPMIANLKLKIEQRNRILMMNR